MVCRFKPSCADRNLHFVESLKDYFSTFGEVQECTVMRDGATGRSRGFGFLTFRDPRTVNVVMVKEHYLDGKIVRPEPSISAKTPIYLRSPRSRERMQREVLTSFRDFKIDPKRAIPREEQERTSKIFVGGVSQEANEAIFKEYFAQYGRVVDATLMMDKDTGRPRGFGFVTFDSEAAVENTLNGDLMILGKPIEVKKAQPRGDMQEGGGDSLGRGGRGGRGGRRNYDDRYNDNMNSNTGGNMMPGGNFNNQNGMTPQMMAQYWQKMQQMFAGMMQQQAMAGGGMGMGMAGMNPQMMQQMQALQQMKAMQMAQQQGGQQNQSRGSASPMPSQGQGNGQNQLQGMSGMNPQMMQQMQAMMQQQMPNGGGNFDQGGSGRGTPGFSAQEQQAFEQRKYEEQQARRSQDMNYGGPTSWEGMYDDVPAPDGGQGGGGYGGHGGGYGHGGYGGRGRGRGRGGGSGGEAKSLTPQSAPPANGE